MYSCVLKNENQLWVVCVCVIIFRFNKCKIYTQPQKPLREKRKRARVCMHQSRQQRARSSIIISDDDENFVYYIRVCVLLLLPPQNLPAVRIARNFWLHIRGVAGSSFPTLFSSSLLLCTVYILHRPNNKPTNKYTRALRAVPRAQKPFQVDTFKYYLVF